MYDLSTIVRRNQRASELGYLPIGYQTNELGYVNVVDSHTGEVVGTYKSAEQACRDYRQDQKEGLVRIEDAPGA